MIRGFGCHEDPAGAQGNWPAFELFGGPIAAPSAIDRMHLFDGRIADQGMTSSCVGHGLARAIQLLLRARVDPTAERPSALSIYSLARIWTGNRSLIDSGTTILAACEAVAEKGYCRESDWPFFEAGVGTWIPWGAFRSGFDQIGLKYHRLYAEGDDRVALIRSALSSGKGVAFGMDVDETFERFTGPGIWPGMVGPREGGHCVAALDYDADSIRIINSWDPSWGLAGMGRIAWDYVRTEHCRSVVILDAAACYSSGSSA